MKLSLIEPCNSDGMIDEGYYNLTPRAKEELFPELKLENQLLNNKKGLIQYSTFAEKQLYYNLTVQEQIDRLTVLLMPEQFTAVQQRLAESGMRKGFACLFYGMPGTGKTETVYQIARRTERDVLLIDISQIKSCWVGESEKNIKETFDRYRAYVKHGERAPILLFNEADAVLGIRQEGAQRAVDKMENSIQNIILQEMEQLDGILIATTNLTQNLDKAFERRFLYKIEFEKPDIRAKTAIWHSMIPELPDSEVSELACRYDFSGGQIENIVRKRTVDQILLGQNTNLEAMRRYCDSERINNNKQERRPVGF